jgi:DNA-directed RNA polymerase subunit RPC12/RpoP
MARREVMIGKKVATLFFCRPCTVGIYEFDPAFNKWRDAEKEIPCANCGKPLNWFARYMDGYFKAVCKYCGTKMEKDGDVQFKKSGAIVIPDEMESDEEEPVRLQIPIDKLKGLSDAQKEKLRKKLNRKSL